MGLAMRLTSSWWNRLSKWRLRWWHRDQQPNQSPSEVLHEHLYRLEDITGAYCVVFVSGKKSKIMGSECSLPWDSESRSPSPTYGRYSCIRIELNIYNIIIIYIHMYNTLYIQECSRNETSSFNHFGWDASWGHEGGGGTGWGIKKDPIVSFILKTLSQMDRLKIFMFSGTTEARHG